MAKLDAKKRAELPNSDFAYVDSKGNRLLPINDEPHVRNALSRFNQVKFEDGAAKERAFRKLLTAATKYGIAPIGFVARQLREAAGVEGPAAELPSGPVTFLLSDMEGSTVLVHRLGDRYPAVLAEVQEIIRGVVDRHIGYEVDARADEFFGAFADAADALAAALEIQRSLRDHSWPDGEVRIRIGLHSGSPARTETGYVGLTVNTAARICSAGHGGQILISKATREALGERVPEGAELVSLGTFELHGLPQPEELLQVRVGDLPSEFPAPRL